VSFVSSVLHFSGGDTFIPALTQPPDLSLDSTRIDDENGNTDSIVFRDGVSHFIGQQPDEQAELQLAIQESDPAIHDLVKGLTYSQTPDQGLVQQFGQGSYLYFKLAPNDQGGFVTVAYNFGTFSITSLSLIPEPAPVFTLLIGCVLMSWVVRRTRASVF
jgi:hypothetical protein